MGELLMQVVPRHKSESSFVHDDGTKKEHEERNARSGERATSFVKGLYRGG